MPDRSANTDPVEASRSPPFRQISRERAGHTASGFIMDAVTADEPGFGILLLALRRRRLPLLLSVLLVPLLALVALRQVTPRYSATATVLYEPNTFVARELQSILRVDPTTEAVMFSQAEIIRSLRIAERVADRFSLYESPEFNFDVRPRNLLWRWVSALQTMMPVQVMNWQTGGSLAQSNPGEAQSAVVLAVREAITVTTPKASRVLEITFTSQDRRLTAAAANLIADLYMRDQLEAKFTAVRHATEWLETRVGELRRDVGVAENRIVAYRASQGLVKGVQAGLEIEQVSRISTDLMQARNELAQVQARLDAVRGKSGAAVQAAIAPSVAPLRAQQDQLAAQLQSQLARHGPRHPEVLALQSQHAEAARSVGAEIARVVAAAEAEWRADKERVAALETSLRNVQAKQEQNEQAQVPLNALEREAEASRTLLQSVLERVQQTAQQTAIETPDARLISAAALPGQPSFPRTVPLLATACAFGLFLGLLLAYLLELSDPSFRSGEHVRQLLGLPCLALVPEIPRRMLGRHSIGDYVAHKPLSPFAEQLRALRAGLWLGRGASNGNQQSLRPKIIAITAARPAEGKTTVSLALARAAAMAGERVLILDCDIREPGLGRLLGMDGNLGLVDCLLGNVALSDVIRRDRFTNLDYLPAGAVEIHSLGLLMSDAMVEVLQSLREAYDLVLIDAPPVFAMPDARIVARLVDATLLCIRWRSTPRSLVGNSLDLLEQAGAYIIGAVLTRVDMRVHSRSGFVDAEIYHPRYGGYFQR